MKIFRRLIRYKKMIGFLLFSFLMRSLVASGFMININPIDGNLFSIMMCEGPAGINAVAEISESPQQHKHHHEHHRERDKYDYEKKGHEFSACSFWSSNSQSLLVYGLFLNIPDVQCVDETVFYQTKFVRQSSLVSSFPRAPPLLS